LGPKRLVADHVVKADVPAIKVTYQILDLLTGQIQHVHIPEAKLQVRLPDAPSDMQMSETNMTVPVGFISGKWLSDIPIKEFMLDHLQMNASTTTGNSFDLQLNTQLRDQHIQFVGKLYLPQLTAPLTFLAGTSRNGQAHAHLTPDVEGESPLLTLEVNPQAEQATKSESDNDQMIVLNGQLHTQLKRLLPVTKPVLSSIYPFLRSVSDLQGELSSQWQAKVMIDQWQVSGKTSISSLSGKWNEIVLPHSHWQGEYQVKENRFRSHSSLKSFSQKVRFDLLVEHDMNIGQGTAKFDLMPVDFDSGSMLLSNILKDWALPFDLNQGQFTGTATVSWNKRLDMQGQVILNGVGGHYNEITFDGMNTTMNLTYDNGIKTRQPTPVTLKNINVGFPVKDISLTFNSFPKMNKLIPVFQIQKFEAFLLGGRAFGGPFDYDIYREKNAFVVMLEGLVVHDLMELERQEGLSGDGLLDGQMPIEVSNGQVVISEGTLAARNPGGVIKYVPTDKVAALAKSNTSVGLMVKALSNFNYDVLDVKTDYLPGGDLHLKVRLQGHNPEWQQGQPINLNLNLQENIPALLRSLQLSSEISEEVKKRVQEKSNKAR